MKSSACFEVGSSAYTESIDRYCPKFAFTQSKDCDSMHGVLLGIWEQFRVHLVNSPSRNRRVPQGGRDV